MSREQVEQERRPTSSASLSAWWVWWGLRAFPLEFEICASDRTPGGRRSTAYQYCLRWHGWLGAVCCVVSAASVRQCVARREHGCPALFGFFSDAVLGADTHNIMETPAREQCSGAKGYTMPEGSTAFSSLEAHPRSKEGINGSLTPARRQRRLSFETNPLSSQKTTSNQKCDDVTAYASTGDQNPLPERKGSRGYGRPASSSDRLEAGGEGISLQETQARIQELERSEFDLKMRLFYAEEQLENAAGRADAVQLHREVADAKRVGFEVALSPLSPPVNSYSGLSRSRVESLPYPIALCRRRYHLKRCRRHTKSPKGNKRGDLLGSSKSAVYRT